MTVTDQQLRAIAFLALASRPTGAPRWDEQGVMANLAKVRNRNVAALTIAAIQAAEDRNAATPGVIPTNGPHWRQPTAAETTAPRRKYDRGTHCGTCSEPEDRCRARWADDHEFVPAARTLTPLPMPDNVRDLIPPRVTKRDREPYVPEHAPADPAREALPVPLHTADDRAGFVPGSVRDEES